MGSDKRPTAGYFRITCTYSLHDNTWIENASSKHQIFIMLRKNNVSSNKSEKLFWHPVRYT
ncbi:uncharacterized protein PHALS_14792 [Plasmopara halstedii]|uniref:Uncharacterized protein n=1 Tax=Plasmopara halstedii TaxID=4781 RepID=A0A0P1ATJ4_PLAHL|nr:uncharacterized protein PHALS_14792 [Plasmopara halstedii]CEG45214.1 hypothetical protein PHALS_14792 [Plasmopara halstedii]|eukprot:XP_024581583.1 hypothetical protein PHALS_14792 [Plasmopara halstedii]